MKTILLCAGYATRLYPLTKERPKPLLPVGNRPILEFILERVKAVEGIDEVLIISNHSFAGHFEKWRETAAYPWPIRVIDDGTTSNETRLGAIGDIHFALKTRNIGEEDLLVIAGDNLFDFDLYRFVEFASTKRPHGVIAVFDVKDFDLAKQYGIVRLSNDGRVLEFLEKPQNPPSTLASCGIYWLPRQTRLLLDRYLGEGHNADQPGHYMCWLAQTSSLFAFPLEGFWYDIGDVFSYQKANAELANAQNLKQK